MHHLCSTKKILCLSVPICKARKEIVLSQWRQNVIIVVQTAAQFHSDIYKLVLVHTFYFKGKKYSI